FAADIDGDLLRQVTVRDRGRDFGDVSHLRREVARHRVHRVGQIFPSAGDAFHVRLATEPSFRSYFARHPRYLRRERAKLIHPRVPYTTLFRSFAADIDGDLLRQVAVRDRGRDLGDVAHLAGQVAGH